MTQDALLDHLSSRFPKWWLPDEITIVPLIPRTSVGKLDKRAIRATYESDYRGA